MIGGVPVIDRGLIAPDGQFQLVAMVVANDAALDLDVESRRGRRAHARVGACCKTQLAEISDLRAERGAEMQYELPLVESAFGAALVGGGEIDVAEAGDPQIRRAGR